MHHSGDRQRRLSPFAPEEGTLKGFIERVVITEAEIQQRVKELAEQINADYADEEIYAICLLKGSLIFTADLLRHVTVPITVDMMRTSSYLGATTVSSGSVKILLDLDRDIADKNVLIVEDIVDTGRTLKKIFDLLQFRKPKTLRICSLLDKPSRRVEPTDIHYRGFSIDDLFVVGYGLDYDDYYRNLPYIGLLNPNG